MPPDRCDVTPLQVCSTILGSHIMKRECQVLSPLPRAVSPTFPNQSEPLHYWCQVSVSRTDTLYRPAVTAPDALHSLSLRRSCLDSHDSLSLPHPLMYVYSSLATNFGQKLGKRCNFCCFAIASFHVCKTGLIAMKFICFVNRKKYMNKLRKNILQIGKNISRFKDVSVDD